MSLLRRLPALLAGAALLAFCASALAGGSATRYLLRSHEQTGYRVKGRPQVANSIAAYVRISGAHGAQATRETVLLATAGFRHGAQEQLVASGRRHAFSLVGVFASSSGAALVQRALFNSAVASQQGGGARQSRFGVPGIPGATGVTVRNARTATANVYWTEGRCVLASGLYLPRGASKSPGAIAAPVVAGAQSQRRRTHGRCG